MPVKSQAQAHLMGMSTSPEGRAKLRSYGMKPVPETVAREYLNVTPKGTISRLKKHIRKKGS